MTGILIILALTMVIVVCTVAVLRQGGERVSDGTYLESPTWAGARLADDSAEGAGNAPPIDLAAPSMPAPSASASTSAPEPPAASLPEGARLRSESGRRFTDNEVGRDQLLNNVVHGLERAPPLPHVLLQILGELDSMGSSAKSLAAIVSGEPVLTAMLLRAANSAATGLGRDIISVDEAVAYLGYSTVRALVLRMQLAKLLPQRRGRGYDSEQLWQHSLVVSHLAGHLASQAGKVEPALASTIGLLHDIGKLALNSLFPDIVARLWKRDDPTAPADESFLARERRLFGADHAFMGGFLAAQWKLPQELADAIRLHHLPGGDTALRSTSAELRRATQMVHVANQLAKYAHVYCADMEIDIIGDEFLKGLGLPGQLDELLASRDVQEAIRRASSLCGSAETGSDRTRRPGR